MNNKFEGKCIRGPYDGQHTAHWAKVLEVRILVTASLIIEGRYEWFEGGIWRWNGPTTKSFSQT